MKDPQEQVRLAREICDELAEISVQYVLGQIDFAEVSFACYDVLEDLHVIASGEYELEEEEEEIDGNN